MGNSRVRLRKNHGKSPAFNFDAGRMWSLSFVIWSLLGFIVMVCLYLILHSVTHPLYPATYDVHYNPHRPNMSKLEEVDEENILYPPPHKQNPRAVRRRGPRKPPTFMDEYMDESTNIHAIFFPDRRYVLDPSKEGHYDGKFFYPGRVWLDTEGIPIQAHGGGIMFDEKTQKYYWYGENKDGPTYKAHQMGSDRVDIIGVSCYSSTDLWSWKHEGIVLRGEQTNTTHDLHKLNVLERPKVIYNSKNRNYVMWMHVDDANYTKAAVGVAVGQLPTGPFTYLYSIQPHGFESRDMTVFKDEDGKAYVFYSTRGNRDIHVGPLTSDYLNVAGPVKRILVRRHREAPAVFKHDGTYYMITSGCSSWAPNRALAHAAGSAMGPWETLGNPCIGGDRLHRVTTFFSQGTFVLPMPGIEGAFIFMADRWKPSDLKDSRYVWLPLVVGGLADRSLDYSFGFPLWPRVSIYWHRRWQLPKEINAE